MHLTATTPLAILMCLMILGLGPRVGLVLALSALPFGSAAAVNLSGLGSIFLAEAALLSLGLSTVLHGARARDLLEIFRPRHPAMPLLALILVALISAVFFPRLFAGQTEVFSVIRQVDGAEIALRALGPSGSNIGQFLRFALAVTAFVIVAWVTFKLAGPRHLRAAIVAATAVHVSLASADLLAPMIGQPLLAPFRNAYVAVLDDQVILGLRRLIGGMPEPSAFAIFTLGLFGFWIQQWFIAPKSVSRALTSLILFALLLRSTSSAAYIGLASFLAIFLIWQFRYIFRHRSAVVFYAILACLLPVLIGAAVILFQLIPSIGEFADRILIEKLNSTSGTERVSWNLQALKNFVDTAGIGAGIGSVRASGWLFAVLGSLGAIGSVLYLGFLYRILLSRPHLGHPPQDDVFSGLRAACAAVLLMSLMLLPQPNLGLLFFTFAGMIAGLMLRQESGADVRAPVFLPQRWRFSSLRSR